MEPKLYLVPTPLGNLEDISERVKRVLGEADALAAEDTRKTRVLYEALGLDHPSVYFSCNDHNEEEAAKRIVRLLEEGKSVALATDAGSPCVSDPGFRVLKAVLEAGLPVEALPGPSAVVTALAASGLSGASFTFLGFPPRKSGQRRNFLGKEADRPHTLVLFESPHRLAALLEDALAALGDRKAAVCLEMTKKFEKVERGWLSDLAQQFEGQQARGEITVVIAGNNPKFQRETPAGEGPAAP